MIKKQSPKMDLVRRTFQKKTHVARRDLLLSIYGNCSKRMEQIEIHNLARLISRYRDELMSELPRRSLALEPATDQYFLVEVDA